MSIDAVVCIALIKWIGVTTCSWINTRQFIFIYSKITKFTGMLWEICGFIRSLPQSRNIKPELPDGWFAVIWYPSILIADAVGSVRGWTERTREAMNHSCCDHSLSVAIIRTGDIRIHRLLQEWQASRRIMSRQRHLGCSKIVTWSSGEF